MKYARALPTIAIALALAGKYSFVAEEATSGGNAMIYEGLPAQ